MLIDRMPPTSLLNAYKGYGSDAIRRQVRQRGTFANIGPKTNSKWKNCFSPYPYRDRNAIERMFCSLKDLRRTTGSQPTSSQQSVSPQPSATGCESRQ